MLAYYRCPMLCNQVLNGLVDGLRDVPLDVGERVPGGDGQLRPAREARAGGGQEGELRRELRPRPGRQTGWHFLTGEQESIDRLTRAVGFRYAYDAKQDQFAHASGIMVLTPDGQDRAATSTASAIRRATCVSAWSRRRRARSARRSTRCCSSASITTRTTGGTRWRS